MTNEQLKKRLHAKMEAKKEYRKKHYIKTCDLKPPPRYDEVYFKGLEWLNSL